MNKDVVEFLLDKGADITFQTAWGETAAHYAALHGTPQALEFLIEEGCPVGKPSCKIYSFTSIVYVHSNKLTKMFHSEN